MPGKVRVSALARELGITSKDALARLAELGVAAKSAVSTLEQDVADRLRAVVASPSADDAAAQPAAAQPAAETPAAETPPPAKKAARKRAAKKAAPAAVDPAAVDPAAVDPAAVDFAAEAAAGGAGDPAAGAPADATEAAAPPPAKKAPRKRASKKTAAPAEPLVDTLTDSTAAETEAGAAAAGPLAPGVLFMAPDEQPPPAAAASQPVTGSDTEDDESGSDPDEMREAAIEQANGARRRRRRGRRGRGGGNAERADNEGENDDVTGDEASSAGANATDADSAAASEGDDSADGADGADDADGGDGEQQGSSSSRRRRRRRRSAGGGDSGDSGDSGNNADGTADGDDPPNTVTHVRDAKKKGGGGGRGQGGGQGGSGDDDGVRGVKGSTRLEAKRQRRRDGRDTSRRRAPILTEAEFLARREAVDRIMAVRQNGDRTQIAVLEDDVLVEHYVTRASATSYVGNVYLGRVQNVLPSMEAAFIDIGKGRNGVLYAGEVNWDAAGLEGKSRAIEQALKSGDSVLVQVTKDPIGHKGARLTSQISLPGRFLVYVPGGGMTGISRRLPDTERHRLKAILKKIVPEDAGVIVRTAAEGASEEDLTHDVERLQAQWETIKTKSEQKKGAPVLLHGEPDLAIRVVRDVFNEDFKSLVVEGDEAWATVSEYLGSVAPDLADRVRRHTKDTDLFHDLRVDEQLMKALDRKVWLPSGGSLVIDRTEAMTVIDVNTGKFVGSGGNLEQTVTRNNLEAAEEIVHQLRLRDVGGIVVIDFIDMVLESNRELVLRRLTECLGRDRTKHQVAEVTSLGLVQMTRKRVGEGLLEAFSEPCEVCKGRGVIIHAEPVDQPSGGNDSSNDDDRPRNGNGNGKRRRGGRNNGSNGNNATTEPEEAPAANDEQRRAAAAAIAAIHRAAGDEDDEAAEAAEADEAVGDTTVSGLATDLVEAVMRVDSHGTAQHSASTGNGAAPAAADPEQPPSTADAGHTPVPEPVPVAETDSSELPGGSGTNGGRRRRRSASRPAGPPVATT